VYETQNRQSITHLSSNNKFIIRVYNSSSKPTKNCVIAAVMCCMLYVLPRVFAKSFCREFLPRVLECYESSSNGEDAKFYHGHPRKHSRRMFGGATTFTFVFQKKKRNSKLDDPPISFLLHAFPSQIRTAISNF